MGDIVHTGNEIPGNELNTSGGHEPLKVSVENAGIQGQIRVAIIDGHEAVRRALRVRLSVLKQFEVVGVSSSPTAAAKLLNSKKPDVILLGLHTNSDDEIDNTVRAVQDLTRESVVIVLAPYADAVERELLITAGAKRYLLKHINSDQLISEIEAAVTG